MLRLKMLRFTVVTPGAVVGWLPRLVVRSWGHSSRGSWLASNSSWE